MGRILVIDDDSKNFDLIRAICDELNHEFLYTPDGEHGIVLARDEQPTVILLDMLLPMTQGWEVAQMLKANKLTGHIPLIGISAYSEGTRHLALNAGCNAFLEKPLDVKQLRAIIAHYSE